MKASATTKGPAVARTHDERRIRRSEDLGQALRFQLDACRATERLDAMVVSDDWGLCVAESGARGARDELAALLPPAAVSGLENGSSTIPGRLAKMMALQRLTIGSSRLFVCALGGQPENRAASLLRVEAGFRRILSAT